MLKTLPILFLSLLGAFQAIATDPAGRLTPAVAKDSFPAGIDTPEGAACDLARAFMRNDAALFMATCIDPYGSAENKLAYHKFLENVVVQMKLATAGNAPASESPQSILKCFSARHLSQGGPASYGYAAFGFEDVMFVDVSARLQNGEMQICRTLVIKDKQGKWRVDPQPERMPLLSAGLDEESPSTRESAKDEPGK